MKARSSNEISYTPPNAGEVIAVIRERSGNKMIVGTGTGFKQLLVLLLWLEHSSSLLTGGSDEVGSRM